MGVKSTSKDEKARLCVECGAPLVIKTAKFGENAGNEFYGCSKWKKGENHTTLNIAGESKATLFENQEGRQKVPKKVLWSDTADNREGWVTGYVSGGARLRCFPTEVIPELKRDLGVCWIAASDIPAYEPSDQAFLRVLAMIQKMLQRGSCVPVPPGVEDAFLEKAQIPLTPRGVGLAGSAPKNKLDPSRLRSSLGCSRPGSLDDQLETGSDEELLFLEKLNDYPTLIRRCFAQAPLESTLSGLGEESSGNRRVDFLVSLAAEVQVIEIDGAQHADSSLDDERDALLAAVGVSTKRISTKDLQGADLSEFLNSMAAKAQGGDGWELLLHGPIQSHRFMLALVESLRRGFLAGDSWCIDLNDVTQSATVGMNYYLELFAAIDSLWGEVVAPQYVQVTTGETSVAFARNGIEFTATLSRGLPSDVAIHLEMGLSPLHQLPNYGEIPHVVVRDAPLPVQIQTATGEPTRRTLPLARDEKLALALRAILQSVFGLDDFREGQLEAVSEVVAGRDCVVLLPTGAGKSLTYQLAGLVLPGRTIVIDPLISLMEDQERSIKAFGIDRVTSISSATTRAGLTEQALNSIRSGDALFVLISPERLQQKPFRESLRVLAATTPINLAVIDEAHCVSEWGHDFRTAYLNVGKTLRDFGSDSIGSPPPLLALTGTASRAVLKDVLNDLCIQEVSPNTIVKPKTFDRKELKFEIMSGKPSDAMARLEGTIRSMPSYFTQNPATFFSGSSKKPFPGLVFVPHTNGDYGVLQVSRDIERCVGRNVEMYSGAAPNGWTEKAWGVAKRAAAQRFMDDETPILVSTKAFGMGIDKPNVRYVVHYGIPGSIESYYQEVGRAGRDRKESRCILIYSEFDMVRNAMLLDDNTDIEELRDLMSSDKTSYKDRDDIDRQLFFYFNSFAGVKEEVRAVIEVLSVLEPLDKAHSQEVLFGAGRKSKEPSTRLDSAVTERAIHRLAVLGVIRDYTVNYGSKCFDVEVAASSRGTVVDNLTNFIERSQPGRSVVIHDRLPLDAKAKVRDVVEPATQLLTEFIYETIARARKRSLREMLLAARDAQGEPEVFRKRILDYLHEGDVSPQIDRLVDQQVLNLDEWCMALIQIRQISEAQEWRGSTARLLVSYPEQPGLRLSRGFAELFLADGDWEDGSRNVVGAIRSATDNYGASAEQIDRALQTLVSHLVECGRSAAGLALLLGAQELLGVESLSKAWESLRKGAPGLPGLSVITLARDSRRLLEVLDDSIHEGMY